MIDSGVGGRRTYFRLRPLNELCRNRPSEVMSRYSTPAKKVGSTHVAFGFLIGFVSLDFGLTTVSSCFLNAYRRGKSIVLTICLLTPGASKRKAVEPFENAAAPGTIRTSDPQIRSQANQRSKLSEGILPISRKRASTG